MISSFANFAENRWVRTCVFSAFGLVMASSASVCAQQTEHADVMVVFDASGSMWGQIDGIAKIEIAQKAFKGLSADWTATGVSAGLIAYGHRRKGDCSDIQLISRPSLEAASAMAGQVNTLTPKGKTPLSAAVRQAADVLKFQENAATVVLLSDGIETCDLDPCAVGADLERLGINFTAHVIGFGIQKESDKAQLRCLADNTGGIYFDADDAEGLTGALKQVAATPAPSVAPAPLPMARVTGPETATINSPISVIWEGPAGPQDFVDIQIVGDTRTSNQPSFTEISSGNPVTLQAPATPGAYELRYVQFKDSAYEVLAVQAIEITNSSYSVQAPQSGIAGSEISISWAGDAQSGDYIDVMPVTKSDSTIGAQSYLSVNKAISGTIELPIAPGAYNIRYILEGAEGRVIKSSQPLEVTPTTATFTAPRVVRPDALISVSWTGPQTRGDYVDLVPVGHTRTGGELSYFYTKSGKNPNQLTAPSESGEYEIRYILEGANVGRAVIGTQRIIVDPNAQEPSSKTTIMIKAELDDGRVPTGQANWSFYKVGEQDVRAQTTQSSEATFEDFAFGDYRVEIEIDANGTAIFGTAEFSVSEGGTTNFAINLKEETPADNQSTEDVEQSLETGGEDASTMMSADERAAEQASEKTVMAHFAPVDVWGQCAGRSSCYFQHSDTGFAWSMPPNWVSEEPFFYATAGGAKAEKPTVHMAIRPKGTIFQVALNPRQWSDALGPCEAVAQGMLCRTTPIEAGDFDDYETIRTGVNEVAGNKPLAFDDISDFITKLAGE